MTGAINELYGVVDKLGNKIGQASWTECHTKGLLHQCVHGILFKTSSKKDALIKKRSNEMVQEPGQWEIAVAGHIFAGKTPDEEILTEFAEELFTNHTLPKTFEWRRSEYFLMMISQTTMRSCIYLKLFTLVHFIRMQVKLMEFLYG